MSRLYKLFKINKGGDLEQYLKSHGFQTDKYDYYIIRKNKIQAIPQYTGKRWVWKAITIHYKIPFFKLILDNTNNISDINITDGNALLWKYNKIWSVRKFDADKFPATVETSFSYKDEIIIVEFTFIKGSVIKFVILRNYFVDEHHYYDLRQAEYSYMKKYVGDLLKLDTEEKVIAYLKEKGLLPE